MNITGLLISAILLIIVLILIFWLRTPEGKKQTPPKAPVQSLKTAGKVMGDDLSLVEGIGPKIQTLLHQAGIHSFKDLSEKKPYELQAILHKANIRIASPDTWAEQAKLLADGKMDELKILQDKLKGGRRV